MIWQKKKIVSTVLAILAVGGVVVWQFGVPAYRAISEQRLRAALAADPRTREEFPNLAKAELYSTEHPDDVQGPISLGLVWKTFGEATGERRYFERSRDAFERGVALFGERNTVILMNAGNIQRQLGDFSRAEELYRQATRVNPGQSEPYLALVDLYRYHLQDDRGDKAIIDTYRLALNQVLTNSDIVHSLAYYLKDLQRFKDALPYFQLLQLNFPDDTVYADAIKELEAGIAAGEDKSTGSAPPAG